MRDKLRSSSSWKQNSVQFCNSDYCIHLFSANEKNSSTNIKLQGKRLSRGIIYFLLSSFIIARPYWSLLYIQLMGAAQNEGTVVDLDLQHPYLTNCKTCTTANETNLLATVPSQLATYKKWKEQLDSLQASLPQQHYLLLPKGHKFDEGGVCSTSGELQLEFDYYPRLLFSQIALRKKQNRRFTEGELWYLLYALVMAKDTLAENGDLVGDIHPRNVFLNNKGDIKIACLRSWPGQVSNYRRAVLEEESGYLAPEDFQRLRLGAMDNLANAQSEIFSIGLTLLTTASLQFQQQIYNMKEKEFQQEIFFSRLGKFQHDTLYSEIFRAVISNLLEVDPTKRMDLSQAKTFLEKHTENIIAKVPLRIDNVGKKLQKTINIMFKAVRAMAANQPPIQPQQVASIPNASIIKPGGTSLSGQRIMNYINFQQKRASQESILPSPLPQSVPKSQTSIQVNSLNNIIFPPQPNSNIVLAKPPVPVSYLVTMINSTNQQPHRPAISKSFSSTTLAALPSKPEITKLESPRYKPFEAITTKVQIQQASPIKQSQPMLLRQHPSITPEIKSELPTKSNEQIKDAVQRPTATEIWLGQQTSIGKLNMLIDTRQGGFGHNLLIDPKYEPEDIQQPPLQSLHASHESKAPQDEDSVVEQVKEQSQQSPVQQSQQKQSKISQRQETPESHSLIKESKVRSGMNHSHHCSSDNNDSLLLHNSAKASKLQDQKEGQSKIEAEIDVQPENEQSSQVSQPKNSEASSKSNKIEVVQLQIGNESKPFSPLVKVWGMNMGFSRTKRQTAPAETAFNVKTVQMTSQKIDEERHDTQQVNQQYNKEKTNHLKPQNTVFQSEVVRKQSQIANIPSVHNENKKADQENKNGSKLLSESNELLRDIQPPQNDKYILIQEESKYNIDHDQSYQTANFDVLKEETRQKQSEISKYQYHTYADITTNGTFEDCWQELLVFLRDPTDYTTKIDPCKVKIRINDDRWSLKVGPGVFDILLNKEQGKFMLKNCEGSRCDGDMLGGVYKDQEKRHRIWFNSAYYYNGVRIPSREIIQECLERCKENIANSKK